MTAGFSAEDDGENKSNKHRWALQLHYVPAAVKETPDEERLAVFESEGKNVTC